MEGQTKIIRLANGYHIWTRKVGESPIKVLLLHGGPGLTHEYLENFQDYLPRQGLEIYFYDQLGSYFSDQPDDPALWNIERFCDEVEEVRNGLGLTDFYLFGHSWGGMLAIEYALKYGDFLKGLIISNTTASIELWDKYLVQLRDSMPVEVVGRMDVLKRQGEAGGVEYNELFWEHFGKLYICRKETMAEPAARSESRINEKVHETLMGTLEYEVNGLMKDWNRWETLHEINNPTLLLGGRFDMMKATEMEEMGKKIPNSRTSISEDGSHLVMWDDPDTYFKHLVAFLHEVEAGRFESDPK